jgi:hypothetical protein
MTLPLPRCPCGRAMNGQHPRCAACRKADRPKRGVYGGKLQQVVRIPPIRPGALVRVLPEDHECDRHSCLCGKVFEVEAMSVVITRGNATRPAEWYAQDRNGRRVSCKRLEVL